MTSLASIRDSALIAKRWADLRIDDPQGFIRARLFAVSVAQWLARMASSYVSAPTAEERLWLSFRRSDLAFATRTFEGDLSLEMHLPGLALLFCEGGRPTPHVFAPEERSPAEAEAWLLVEMLHRGIDRETFTKTLPYAVRGLLAGDAEKYDLENYWQGLDKLAAWFATAATALEAAAARPAGGTLACWPQTLELIITLARSPGDQIGFSPGTGEEAEPYFFAGSAQTGNRQVLTASDLADEDDPMAAAIAFLRTNAN